MTRILRFSFYLLLFFFALSCGSSEGGDTQEAAATPGVTDTEIVLGSWGPITGPAALWGAVPKGMDAYFKMINEDGGIHGRQIKFIYKDDAYDPSRTVPAVREMVQKDEVFAFVGGVGTAPNMAVKDFIIEEGIPWVCPASGATHWAYPPEKNIFSAFPLYFDEAEIQINYAVNELGAKKIAIIYQNDDFGKSALVSAKNALKAHDLELVAEVSTEVLDSDLSSHAARLQESGAEVVLLWTLPRQAAIILGTTAVTGYQPQWIASLVLSDMGLMHNITKGAWEGVIFGFFGTLSSDMSNPTMAKYKAAVEKHQPDLRWGAFPASGFAYAEPLVEALQRAGRDLTRESLIAALESLDGWQGTGAKLTFGSENRQGHRSMYLVKCISGEESEVLTDYMYGTSDVEMLINELEVQ
jgi:ABC-type branched-subunit amino acid transport system substrate-binding protein